MNFSSILSEIEKFDPEVYERTSERRTVIKNWSRKVALTALPFALGSLFKKAYGKGTANVVDVLNYALKLEYLEAEMYNRALTTATFTYPNSMARRTIETIAEHEKQHVTFLKNAITAANGVPIAKPAMDLSGGAGGGFGPFADAFWDYTKFLTLAQTLEDTGVRAYKGAAPELMSDNAALTAALNIHSVEARHASHIRQMRKLDGTLGGSSAKPWITGTRSSVVHVNVDTYYKGEDNTVQGGVNIVNIGGQPITSDAATEAFDEPLSMTDVAALVDPFFPR